MDLALDFGLDMGLGRVEMTDGDGERVGGVSRVVRLLQVEEARNHKLHLLLGGEAVADDRRFNGERGVFGHRFSTGGGGQEGDSADLAELECGLGVGGEEDLFDGDDVGLVEFDLGAKFSVDLRETLRCGVFLIESYRSGRDVAKARGGGALVERNDAEACELGSTIDSEYAHAGSLAEVRRSWVGGWGGVVGMPNSFLPFEMRGRGGVNSCSVRGCGKFLKTKNLAKWQKPGGTHCWYG